MKKSKITFLTVLTAVTLFAGWEGRANTALAITAGVAILDIVSRPFQPVVQQPIYVVPAQPNVIIQQPIVTPVYRQVTPIIFHEYPRSNYHRNHQHNYRPSPSQPRPNDRPHENRNPQPNQKHH